MTRADILAIALVALVIAAGYWTGHEQEARAADIAGIAADLSTLTARLDIERQEREDLARRLKRVADLVHSHDAELELQAGAIEMLEQESRATDDEVEREWPHAVSASLWGKAHP